MIDYFIQRMYNSIVGICVFLDDKSVFGETEGNIGKNDYEYILDSDEEY